MPIGPQTTFAVTPVVDYEPPARDVRQCRPPSPTALRRRNTHVPQRHSSQHPAQPAPAMSASMRQAARFADAALRRVLEVIDRRRPIAQLNGLLAAGLVDSVLSANRLAGADGGWRCCAGCDCRRWAARTGSPRPRCSAATAAGTACTPSPAVSSGWAQDAGRWSRCTSVSRPRADRTPCWAAALL